MYDESVAPAPTGGSRGRWVRRFVVVAIVVAVVAAAAGYLFLANAYMPLAEGPAVGSDPSPQSRFVMAQPDPFDSDHLWIYCGSITDSHFAWFITLQNNGPLPVTILGGPFPSASTANSVDRGFALVDFAAYRKVSPTGTPLVDQLPADPWTAPALSPTLLAPGDYVELWARYQTGSLALQSGSTELMRSVWVRYSMLGMVRTAEVPFRDGVAISGDCATW